jgi:hypothetical protein
MTLIEFVEKNPFSFDVPELDNFMIRLMVVEGVLVIHAHDDTQDYGDRPVHCFQSGLTSLLGSAAKLMGDFTCVESGWIMVEKITEYRSKARPYWEPEYLRRLN